MRIVHISPEAVPYAKTGGLADVAGALSAYLARSGHAVTLFLPLYRMIREAGFEPGPVELELGPAELGLPAEASIRSLPSGSRLSVRVIDAPELFDRDGLYGVGGSDHPDNLLRFAVFCRASLCAVEESPDILHVHDWQSALAAVLLRAGPPPGAAAIREQQPASALTLHNLAYQGRFAEEAWLETGLPDDWYRPDRLEYYGGINLLKGGLVTADRVTTVSPGYAEEISTPEFGFGLEGNIQRLTHPVEGILNGIDTAAWNPADDAFLDTRYDVRDLSGKAAAKRELQREFGLPESPGVPLFGLVSRLVDQKGIPLIEALEHRFGAWHAQFVFLGNGEPRYEQLIEQLDRDNPNVGSRVAFSEPLAHLVEAGSDFFLMPSAFEPCGLNQMISQRYGTIPIVHRVGGLADSVIAITPETLADESATGIMFELFHPDALAGAILDALDLYTRPETMESVIRAGMETDFSWQASGRKYEELYERMLEDKSE
jgi:starch synthase